MNSHSRQRRFTLLATILGSAIGFLDASVVSVALPSMARSLELGLSGTLWVNLSYMLALSSLLLLAGSIGDIFGQRRVFNTSVVLFAMASLGVGLSPSVPVIIAARTAQGIAGAFLTTTSLALLRITFQEDSGKAIGLWTSGTTLATILGPIAGGLIIGAASWRWIFLINVPICIAAFFLSSSGRPSQELIDENNNRQRNPIDLIGALLGAASIVSITFGLVQATSPPPERVVANAPTLGAATSLIFAILFVIRERSTRFPMLPLKLFRVRNFACVNVATLLIYAGLGGAFFFLGLFVQAAPIGLSPFAASFVSLPIGLMLVFLTPLFGAMSDQRGPRMLLVAGPLLMAIGACSWLLLAGANHSAQAVIGNMTRQDVGSLAVGMIVFGLGLAILVSPITATALRAVPTEYSGIASGVNTAVARIGGMIATAAMGAVAASAFGSASAHDTPFAVEMTSKAMRLHSVHAFREAMLVAIVCLIVGAIVAGVGISNRDAVEAGSSDA